jgi:S-disulfanyl-L-cysteine oxidoreductase SoxD
VPNNFSSLLISLATVVLITVPALAGDPPHTVLDGVYTAAQASRGQAVYDRSCSGCHGPNLDGGGQARPLHTTLFLDVWREDYLLSLFQYMQTRMPPGKAAGTLPEHDYIDILAFVLQVNQFPAGKEELARAVLDTTLLVGPDGPQPLPPSATVRAAGCLTHPGGDNWTLTRATSAARVRDGSDTDDKELNLSATAPLATHSFRLSNLDDGHTEAELTALTGKKVQAKGVLNGEGDTARIYVLSLHAVPADPGAGPACDK